MLSRLVIRLQLAELALLGTLAAGLAAGGWRLGAALAAALAIALGWRFAFVVLSSLVCWMYRSPRAPEHRLGVLRSIAMVLDEYRAFLLCNLVELPWDGRVLRPDPPPVPGASPPIVLVHGYFANRGYFRPLVKRLRAAGLGPVFAPNLRSWLASVERYEEELHAAVERIAAGTGQRVILVGHSMGGLGIRAYLAKRGAARVARIVTLGSPHHGSVLASLGTGENARQMCRGSAFLAWLEGAEGEQGPGVPALSIYSTHDNMVAPQESSRLPWARNVALPGLGHIAMLGSEPLWRVLREELR